jgi:hypothetical protein
MSIASKTDGLRRRALGQIGNLNGSTPQSVRTQPRTALGPKLARPAQPLQPLKLPTGGTGTKVKKGHIPPDSTGSNRTSQVSLTRGPTPAGERAHRKMGHGQAQAPKSVKKTLEVYTPARVKAKQITPASDDELEYMPPIMTGGYIVFRHTQHKSGIGDLQSPFI